MSKYCLLTLSKFHDQLNRMLGSIKLCQPDLSLEDIYVVDDGLDPSIRDIWKVNYAQGRKPFCFARNFNEGINVIPKDKDVFFLGDDVVLTTPGGIDILSDLVHSSEVAGMAGPVIVGGVKNVYQRSGILTKTTWRQELENKPGYEPTLMFVAVYIKREVINKVPPLPDRLIGYGYEDDYFTRRMRQLGYDWLIEPKVVVLHGWDEYGAASSYLRSGQDVGKLIKLNKQIYRNILSNEGEQSERPPS